MLLLRFRLFSHSNDYFRLLLSFISVYGFIDHMLRNRDGFIPYRYGHVVEHRFRDILVHVLHSLLRSVLRHVHSHDLSYPCNYDSYLRWRREQPGQLRPNLSYGNHEREDDELDFCKLLALLRRDELVNDLRRVGNGLFAHGERLMVNQRDRRLLIFWVLHALVRIMLRNLHSVFRIITRHDHGNLCGRCQ